MPSDQDAPLKTYQDHLARDELAYQFSREAGRAVFYPRVLCPFTGSDQLEWRISKGLGTVYATTVVHPSEGKPFNVALIDCDEGLSFDEPGRGHRAGTGAHRTARAFPRASGLKAMRRLIRSSLRWRAHDGRTQARWRGNRRGRGIRPWPGGRRSLRLRSDGAGGWARARRLRPEIEGRRRAVLGHHPEPVVGPGARRIPRNQSSIPGFDHRRRLILRVSRGACDGRDCARPLQRRRDCLWQHTAQRRPQAGIRARDQSVRNAIQTVPAIERLRACGLAAYASVRHDARATGRGRGGRAGMGAAQPGGMGEEAADDRWRALVPDGELSLHGAGLLSRHRWRRRHRRHIGRTRQVAQEASPPMCWVAASRPPTPTFRACPI